MFMTAQEALRLTQERDSKLIYNCITEAINRGSTQTIIGNGQEAFRLMNQSIANALREKGYKVDFKETKYPAYVIPRGTPIYEESKLTINDKNLETMTGTVTVTNETTYYTIKEWIISWADTSSVP